MSAPTPDRHPLAGRLFALLFSGLFALAFGGVGLGMGLWPLLQTTAAAWQVRQWQPVQALVLSSELLSQHDSDSGTLYGVRAEYAYELGGQRYLGRRVGLDPQARFDNLDDWHRHWFGRLRQAQDQGTTVTAWVNPQSPQEALLDRQVRWSLAAFRLPFALLFTAVGAVAAWAFVTVLMGRSGKHAWTRPEDAATLPPLTVGLRPQPGKQAALWLVGVVCVLFALPFVVGFWHRPGGARWAASAFFALGGLVVLAALRETLRARRFRGARLSSSPSRVCTGASVQMQLELPAAAAAALQRRNSASAAALTLRLGMHHVDESSSSRQTCMLWEQTCEAPWLMLPDGAVRCSGQFTLPGDAAPSGAIRRGERVQWLLDARGPGGRSLASFEVTVHQGPQGVTNAVTLGSGGARPWPVGHDWKTEHAVPPPRAGEAAPALPATVALREDARAWRLTFRRRWPRTLAALACMGLLVLLWPQLAAWPGSDPVPQGAGIWRLLAAAALWALALQGAGAHWVVQVSDTGLHIDHGSWLWSRQKQLSDGQVRGLVHRLAYSIGSGAQGVEHHALWVKTLESGRVKLSPAVAHAVSARAVAWHVQDALAHRRGRFAPGTLRGGELGLGPPFWRRALAWMVWLLGVLAMRQWLAGSAGA